MSSIDHDREVVELSVYDGPTVELTGIVVEALRAACEVKLGDHFAEAAVMWNENEGVNSLDREQLQAFLWRLKDSVRYVETLIGLAPLLEDDNES